MKVEEKPVRQPDHRRGSAAVTAALGTLPFPVSKEEAIQRVGDWKVPYGDGSTVPLRAILEKVPEDGFEDVGEALIAVDQHWGRAREDR